MSSAVSANTSSACAGMYIFFVRRCRQTFAGFISGGELGESAAHERADDRDLVAVVLEHVGLFEKEARGFRDRGVVESFAFEKIIRGLYLIRHRRNGAERDLHPAELLAVDFRRRGATHERPIEVRFLAHLKISAATIL